jgi:nicotinate-nucleotide adenylyltransferase
MAGLRRVAVFGGSFNPPHVAHVLAVAWVLSTSDVDQVLVVPTFQHPFAKELAPYPERVRMCELAFDWFPHARVRVSRVEEQLGGESFTLRTLEALKQYHPDWAMRLVMGADLLIEAHKWHRFDRVKELAPPLVLGRSGTSAEGAPPAVLPAVSSTDVRAKVAAGDWACARSLVPPKVLNYIKERGLYTS